MAEEVLRFRTSIETAKTEADMRRLGTGFQRLGQQAGQGVRQAIPHWQALGTAIGAVSTRLARFSPIAMEVANALGRAGGPMAAFKVGLIGVAAAAGTFYVATRRIAEAAEKFGDLERRARALGTTEQTLRALSNAAGHVGVSADEAVAGVEALTLQTQKLRSNLDGARDSLEEVGLGPFGRRLELIADAGDRAAEVLRFKDTLLTQPGGLLKATELLERTRLGVKYLHVTADQFQRSRINTRPLLAGQQDNLKQFHKSFIEMGQAWDTMITRLAATVAPAFTVALEVITVIIDKISWALDLLARWKAAQPGLYIPKGMGLTDEELNKRFGTPGGAARPLAPQGMPPGAGSNRWLNPTSGGGLAPLTGGGGIFGAARGIAGLFGGGGNANMQGAAGGDVLADSDETLTRTTKEGTFQALMDFDSYLQATRAGGGGGPAGTGRGGGIGGVGGLGSGSIAGGGGPGPGGGGGSGGGGGGQDNTTPQQPSAPAGTPANPNIGTERAPGTFGPPAPAGATVEGAPAGSGGGTVPPDLLGRAAEMVRGGGKPQEVQNFLKKHGMNKSGPWCGMFAASVVKEAGGTPPKNPEVASNWRNWGTEVSASEAKPGDVAVRRGPSTGSTGSHVAFVGTGGVKDGKFERMGGNQGGVNWRATSGYQFYRGAPQANDQPATARAQGVTPGPAPASVPPGAGGGRISGTSDVNEAVRATAGQAGMSEASWKGIADIESGLKPGSNRGASTQYKGLYQIGTEEWQRHGRGASQYDPMANAKAASAIAGENNKWFKGRFGRDPEPHETYLMHQQGRGFYSKNITTNLEGNRPPGYRGPLNRETHEREWKRVVAEKTAKFTDPNAVDRANATQTAMQKSAVNVNLTSNGTAASAKVKTEGPQFAETQVRQSKQMVPTSEAGVAGITP